MLASRLFGKGVCVFAMVAIRTFGGAFVPSFRLGSSPLTAGESSPVVRQLSPLRALSYSTTTASPLVVCGPSGVGKGTIINKFMEGQTREETGRPKFGFSVSHTTRQPRPGEVNGEHYHFVTKEFMRNKIESGSFFIEYAEVHGNLYGTSFESIFDVNAESCLLDIDVEGVKSIKEFQSKQRQDMKKAPILGKDRSTQQYLITNQSGVLPMLDAKFIFIAPPSIDVLRERLVGRGTETPETLERRFRNAKAELDYGMHPGNFDAIVINDDLDLACKEFKQKVDNMYSIQVDA